VSLVGTAKKVTCLRKDLRTGREVGPRRAPRAATQTHQQPREVQSEAQQQQRQEGCQQFREAMLEANSIFHERDGTATAQHSGGAGIQLMTTTNSIFLKRALHSPFIFYI